MDTPTEQESIAGDQSNQPTHSKVKVPHLDFYFSDIIFLVENQLFKVPRRNFAIESEVFADMFQLPAPTIDSRALDGSSDDQPLRLDGIKKSDFAQLLRVMFPLDSQQPDSLSLEEWTSVLKLSSMWQFHKIRTTAIKNMDTMTMDLVDKIVIARRYDIPTWLIPTLNTLIQRESPIGLSEGNRLGMEWVLKVAEVRERGTTTATQNRTCTNCHYTGPARCNSCSSTTANRCGSCSTYLPNASTTGKRGARSNVDYSTDIREVFDLV